MAIISKKKTPYKIKSRLRQYLKEHSREVALPIQYRDLLRYDNKMPLYDANGKDTLWQTVLYPQYDMENIHASLKKIYSLLTADGDVTVIQHLFVDRIDICPYGNSHPFRVRIVNNMNDNFDYFYIKIADASRIYGLELEHLLSPNRINYLVDGDSVIEEHIAGIPGDRFMKDYLPDPKLNKIRIVKEFVKFNERCFYRLLGDMHSSNFVIDITPDFEEVHYRIRAIDFDQQSYESRKNVYFPQFFKQNNDIIKLGLELMTPETVRQYQWEERMLVFSRLKAARYELKDLLDAMTVDSIAPKENVLKLRKELAKYHNEPRFLKCESMGQLVKLNLKMLVKKTERKDKTIYPNV